jgi:hypothetical protein
MAIMLFFCLKIAPAILGAIFFLSEMNNFLTALDHLDQLDLYEVSMDFRVYKYSLLTGEVDYFGQFRTLHEAGQQSKPLQLGGYAIAILYKGEVIQSSSFLCDLCSWQRMYFHGLPKWVARIKNAIAQPFRG